MKRSRSRALTSAGALASIGALILGLGTALPASAAETTIDPTQTGSLTIHKYQHPTTHPHDGGYLNPDTYPIPQPPSVDNPPVVGAAFTVCRVPESYFEADGLTISENAWWEAAANAYDNAGTLLATLLAARDTLLAESPAVCSVTPATNSDGYSVLTGLTLGLYYVWESTTPTDYVPIAPFLINIPLTAQPRDPAEAGVCVIDNVVNPSISDEEDCESEADEAAWSWTPPGTWNYNVHVYPKDAMSRNEKHVVTAGISVGDTLTYEVSSEVPYIVDGASLTQLELFDALDNNIELQASPITVTGPKGVCTDNGDGDAVIESALTKAACDDETGTSDEGTTWDVIRVTYTEGTEYNVTTADNTLVVAFIEAGLAILNNANPTGVTIEATFNVKTLTDGAVDNGARNGGLIYSTKTDPSCVYTWDETEQVWVSDDPECGFNPWPPAPTQHYGGERILKYDISRGSCSDTQYTTKEACEGATGETWTWATLAGAEFMLFASAADAKSYDALSATAKASSTLPLYFYTEIPSVCGEWTNTTDSTDITTTDPASDDYECSLYIFDEAARTIRGETLADGTLLVNGLLYKGETFTTKTYYLLETKAPAGFELLAEPVAITISQQISESGTCSDTEFTTQAACVEAQETWTYDQSAGAHFGIANAPRNTGFPIPLTGGTGAWFLTVAGLLGFVIVVLVTSRTKKTA